jgi:hypothetical protein
MKRIETDQKSLGTPTASWPTVGYTGIVETSGREKRFSVWGAGIIYGYTKTESEARRWLSEARHGRQGDPETPAGRRDE